MWDIWYVRGVVFVVVIFSINSCHNLYICIIYIFEFVVNNYLYIYYFESVSCIQHIVIKPPSKLINFPLKKIIIRIIESLGNFKIFPWRFIYLFKNGWTTKESLIPTLEEYIALQYMVCCLMFLQLPLLCSV